MTKALAGAFRTAFESGAAVPGGRGSVRASNDPIGTHAPSAQSQQGSALAPTRGAPVALMWRYSRRTTFKSAHDCERLLQRSGPARTHPSTFTFEPAGRPHTCSELLRDLLRLLRHARASTEVSPSTRTVRGRFDTCIARLEGCLAIDSESAWAAMSIFVTSQTLCPTSAAPRASACASVPLCLDNSAASAVDNACLVRCSSTVRCASTRSLTKANSRSCVRDWQTTSDRVPFSRPPSPRNRAV